MPNYFYFYNSVLRLNLNMKEKNLSTSQRIITGVGFFSYLYPLIYFITNLPVMIFTGMRCHVIKIVKRHDFIRREKYGNLTCLKVPLIPKFWITIINSV